ncbi:MAG: SPOR domain-containing protein [Caulobacterales bacterium]|jgi:cell division septation protein DedD
MSGPLIIAALRARLGVALAAALACGAAPAWGQAPAVSYPPSRALGDVAAWLQRDTPLPLGQVVDVGPSAVTAITASAPMGGPRRFLATIASEAVDPAMLARDGIASWSIPVEIDCDRRMARLGTMTGYPSRDLKTGPREVRKADDAWVDPAKTAPLGSAIRALCDRDFARPFAGRAQTAETARPAGRPPPAVIIPPGPAPTAEAAAAPSPKPKPMPKPPAGGGAFALQVGASPSLPDSQRLLARFKKKFGADLGGLTTSVATVQANGRTVNRVLLSGFASSAQANAFCNALAAAKQACFVRR